MVTGDNLDTATAIAKNAGILKNEEEAKKTMGDVRSRRGYMDPKGGMGN